MVARLADEAVTAGDLAAFWYERRRDEWRRTVDDLVDERIALREARRLGLSVPPAVLAKAVDAEARAREAQLRETYGDEVRLADEVERAYGFDVERWKREVLEPRLRTQHLLVRVVRLDTRRRPRVKARVIVLDTEERARGVAAKLAEGADFSLVALGESIDPTARAGGELPAVARGDLAFPEVEERLFEAAPGAVVGPLRVVLDGRATWHLYRVVEQVPPWTGGREEILGRLEKDLAEDPLQHAEFERWRARMRRDFGVEVVAPDGTVLRAEPLAGDGR